MTLVLVYIATAVMPELLVGHVPNKELTVVYLVSQEERERSEKESFARRSLALY